MILLIIYVVQYILSYHHAIVYISGPVPTITNERTIYLAVLYCYNCDCKFCHICHEFSDFWPWKIYSSNHKPRHNLCTLLGLSVPSCCNEADYRLGWVPRMKTIGYNWSRLHALFWLRWQCQCTGYWRPIYVICDSVPFVYAEKHEL